MDPDDLMRDAAIAKALAGGQKYIVERLDKQERIMSSIVMAVQEMWASLEAVIRTIVSGLSEEEQDNFVLLMADLRKEALKSMQEIIDYLDGNTQQPEPDDTEPAEDNDDTIS